MGTKDKQKKHTLLWQTINNRCFDPPGGICGQGEREEFASEPGLLDGERTVGKGETKGGGIKWGWECGC